MQELTDADFMSTIESESVVLIDFFASWCGACRMAAPMYERVAKDRGIPIYKIDVDKNPETKDMLSLPGLPSLGLFMGGEPKDLINTTKESVVNDFLKSNGL